MKLVIFKVVEVAMGQDLNMYVATPALMWLVSMSAVHGLMILPCLNNAQVSKQYRIKIFENIINFALYCWIEYKNHLVEIDQTAVEAATTSMAPFMTRRQIMKPCDQCRCSSESQKNILKNIYLHRCHSVCIDNAECKEIEYWEGSKTRHEYKDPQKHTFYSHHADVGFPSSVYNIKSMN